MSTLHEAAAPRSFVDLRKFASEKSATIGTAATSDSIRQDRFLANRCCLELPPGPVSVGVIALDAGCGVVPSQPADEFIIVSQGTITLTQDESTLTLAAGDSAVLCHGAAFSWAAQGPVSIIFMRDAGSQPGQKNIVPIRHDPQLEPSGAPAAELLLTPTPVCRNYTDYLSADGEFVCGTWDSAPYHRRAMSYRHFELMHLLEGSVTFVDEAGRTGTFERGDIFLVEQSAQCSWESREHVAKVYAIYRPA